LVLGKADIEKRTLNGSKVRNAVIASAGLAAASTNDRFYRCGAAMPDATVV